MIGDSYRVRLSREFGDLDSIILLETGSLRVKIYR